MDVRRVALVSGANRGLGFEISRQLGKQGISVVMGSREEAKGSDAVATLKGEGIDAYFCHLDVTNLGHIADAQQFIESRFGRLDILVNNAGIMIDGKHSVLDLELMELTRTFGTNVYAPFFLCKTFVPMMLDQNYGRIVNISSTLGSLTEMANPNSAYELVKSPAYRMSKTAINSLTTNLAMELRGRNILVNSCCPGWTKTDMGGPMAPLEVAEGADTPVWLATLPDGGPSGFFFYQREKREW